MFSGFVNVKRLSGVSYFLKYWIIIQFSIRHNTIIYLHIMNKERGGTGKYLFKILIELFFLFVQKQIDRQYSSSTLWWGTSILIFRVPWPILFTAPQNTTCNPFSILIIAIVTGLRWFSHCVFIDISFLISDVKYFSIYMFSICMTSSFQ